MVPDGSLDASERTAELSCPGRGCEQGTNRALSSSRRSLRTTHSTRSTDGADQLAMANLACHRPRSTM